VKNISIFKKILILFCPAGDVISVEKHHPFTPCPAGDKRFSFPHYVPDGTLADGEILFSTNMLSLTGRKTTFFKPDFSKNEYYIFIPHLRGEPGITSDNHLR
jgi:hypothetical protein